MMGVRLAVGHPAEIVRIEYVDPVAAQARTARLIAAHHGVVAVIERALDRFGRDEALARAREIGIGHRIEPAADLGRHDRVRVGIDLGERRAEPLLAQSEAVMRGGVEIADAGIPRGADRSEEHTSELQSLMRISY